MQEEHHRPKRQTLDRIALSRGRRLRIYFPYDAPPAEMTATGNVREKESRMSEHEYEFEDGFGKLRWIPGWYIAHHL